MARRGSIRLLLAGALAVLLAGPAVPQEINELSVGATSASPGTAGLIIPIFGHSTDDVSGYTIVLTYDPLYVVAQDVNLDGTMAEAVGAEFVNFQDYPDDGFFVFAVLLDLLPPYDGQVIPAVPGYDLVYANFVAEILPEALEVETTDLIFEDSLGTPPVQNMFVIGTSSVSPGLVTGAIEIIGSPPFVRGDANEDGTQDLSDAVRILMFLNGQISGPSCLSIIDVNDDGLLDIADPLYALDFMFLGGPIIPAPFPEAGLDPTPDDIPCE